MSGPIHGRGAGFNPANRFEALHLEPDPEEEHDPERADGAGLHLLQIQEAEPCLTDDMLQRMLSALCELNIVQRGESGAWLLSRDLNRVSLSELYESVPLRVPAKELVLPCHNDDIGRAASAAMDHLRQPLLDPLAHSIGSFLHPTKE